MKTKIIKFFRKLTVFDWLALMVVLFGLIFISLFIFKEEKWLKVELNVSRPEWWFNSENPPVWLANNIRKGDKQYDFLGNVVGEVLDVRSYELGSNQKSIHLTLNLKVEVDSRRKKFKYEHRPLEIGKSVELEIGNTGFQGVVTYIEGIPDTRIWEEKIVETRIIDKTYFNAFPETTGVFPWVSESIEKGDQMRDTQDRVVAEVLEKKVSPADKIITTSDGRIIIGKDPTKHDVILILKIKTFNQNGVNYYLEDFTVKVREAIPLFLPKLSVYPTITKILK